MAISSAIGPAIGIAAMVGLPVLAAAPARAGAVTAGAVTAGTVAAGAGSAVDRTLRDPRIGESSGLVMSRRAAGVVWTHNDSGNPPLLYAVGRDGSTVATARVSGAANVDWEAIAPLTGRDGGHLLAIGDFGDNTASRSRIEIDVVPEPAVTGNSRISPVRVILLHYPDGPKDAETLLADPRDGRLYVVTKGLFSSMIYAVPDSAWPGTGGGRTVTATLQPIGQVQLTLVTDGAVLPDGRVLLRTYGQLALLAPLRVPAAGSATASDAATLSPLDTLPLPAQQQGEGLAVVDPAAGILLLSSEGARSPILRLTVPPDLWSAGAAAAASSTPSAQRSTGGPVEARASGPATADALRPWLISLAGAGLFVVLLLISRLVRRARGGG
jgi:hypothetical protein